MTMFRHFLFCFVAAAAGQALPAMAQGYPTQPVRIVVPFAAGGGGDMVTRALASRLSEQMKQSFIVENRTGAGGTIGGEFVARSKPDGHTLLQSGDHVTLAKALYRNLNFDPLKDLVGVAAVSLGPHVLIAHPSLEAGNLQELVALARARPGTLSYGTPGVGTAQDLFGAMLKGALNLDMVSVPYKGGGALTQDLLGGQVRLGVIGLPPVIQHIKAGKLKALAVTSPQRSALLPAVPSVAESHPGLGSVQWIGLAAPAGTPDAVLARLAQETSRALEHPQLRDLFGTLGLEAFNLSGAALARFMQEDFQAFDAVVRKSGLKVD